ncbi:MAG: DUF4435 domain-containing protein [Methylococcales bacterium]|nr:DUF4435 domain-containing protein [Methylococcales bacterium]
MTSLENYAFESARQNAFNFSQPKNKLRFITVYVEGIEDKSFWFHLLSPHIKPLQFRCFSNNSLKTGKKGLIKHFDKTGKWLVVCLDSDYDYLFQDLEITKNSFIFQTYTYATENLKCYAESLIGICADVTHNPTEKIDFVEILTEYSKIIYKLFIWHLYFLKSSNKDEFTTFYEIIQIPSKFNINTIYDIFKALKNCVNSKASKLTQKFPQYAKQLDSFSKKLKVLGLEKNNTYLFIQGHTLYDNVVLSFLRVVCDTLKRDSINEINQSDSETEHKNKIRKDYIKSIGSAEERIKLVLSLNKDFKSCFLFKKIENDIQAYLEVFKAPETHV